ncbi:MFS transporter [Candidatus Berkiella cookevillensis]|nr:MFS transporter [Candidatus Berkiella cookevillensis]
MLSPENKLSGLGLLVWGICALFFMYEFSLRTILGTFQYSIMYDLSLSPFSFSVLSTTAFLLTYGLMQLPAGFIVDRYGLKKTLAFAISICVISSIAFSFSYQFKTAVIVRMIMGVGASFGFICLLVAVYDWMPKKFYGLFIGLSQFIGTMGPMLSAGPLNSLALNAKADWRTILLSLGFLGGILLVFVILYVKNNEDNIGVFRVIKKPEPIKKDLLRVIGQSQVWLIALYSALVYFTIEYLSENEGKAFLELNGFSSHYSSYMITIGWLGYAISCPLLGVLSDIFKRRKMVMIMAALLSFISIIFIVYQPISKTIVACAFFFLGFGAGGQSVAFAIMAEQCSKTYLAVGLAFNNTMITILSSVNAPVIGWLLNYNNNAGTLSLADYYFAFPFVITLIAFSIIISVFFIKETFCRPTKGFTFV